MSKIFDMDSPVMRVLNRVGDLLILNLLMIVCCLPVITMGASFTAMHYVLLKIVRGEEGYLFKGFFKSFARNFKQATILWLLVLLVVAVYVGDILIFSYSGMQFPKVLIVAVIAIAVLAAMVVAYIFPLLARFDNTVWNTLKNAALMAFLNLPKTILMVVVYALPLVIAYFSTYSIIFVIMFGYSVPAYIAAWLYSGIFKKFEPDVETTSDLEFTVTMDGGKEEEDGKSE